jgi:hypothetical protein
MIELFSNGASLARAMGRWPSFHDANVKSVRREGDVCIISVHVFEMTSRVDANGFYELRNHHLVTLTMGGVVECTLPEGYETDTLFGLSADKTGNLITVECDSAIGAEFDWRLVCRLAEVTDARACDARGRLVE